jgi:hypothetical protein
MKWCIMPTIHYLTNHYIQFAREDKGAYHTVLEGSEHHHKNDRDVARMVFPHESGANTKTGPMRQILETQDLRLILLNRGHSPSGIKGAK